MADLQKIRNELANDPLSRGYSGMTDAQRLAALTTADITTTRDVVITPQLLAQVFGTASASAMLEAMETAAASDVQLKWMLQIIYENRGGLSTATPGVTDKLTALAGVGTVITPVQLAVFEGARQTTISRAAQLGLGEIHLGDVIEAGRGL